MGVTKQIEPRKFCNVALLPEDHERLRRLAELEQRTMTRQLSVIIRKEYSNTDEYVNSLDNTPLS